MIEHAPDCGLRASPPTYCTCGLSRPFKLWEYRAAYDVFGFEAHSRESLVARTASAAIVHVLQRRHDLFKPKVPSHVYIRRAVQDNLFHPVEWDEIVRRWDRNFVGEDPSDFGTFKERHGLHDIVVDLDGSPLDAEFRESIERRPYADEVRAAVGWWLPHWEGLAP